jgi:hypothetical protein
VPAKSGSRYRKTNEPPVGDTESSAYWESILKQEWLGMQRGKSKKLVYGWEYRDTDPLEDSE